MALWSPQLGLECSLILSDYTQLKISADYVLYDAVANILCPRDSEHQMSPPCYSASHQQTSVINLFLIAYPYQIYTLAVVK